jgi:hypothetical protein
MATMSLLFKPFVTKIGAERQGVHVIELDAAISTQHTRNVTATKHPVEKGAKITDHLRPEPEQLVIEGLVSNTPLGRTAQTRAVGFVGSEFQTTAAAPSAFGTPGYAEEAFKKLDDIAGKGVLVTIATQYMTYTDMALTSFVAPRDGNTGDALRFTATFEKIVIVSNKLTTIRPSADPRSGSKSKAGRQALKEFKHHAKVIRKVAAPWVEPIQRVGAAMSKFKFKTPGILGGL